MIKPITPEEMKAYVDATWKKCQSEAWAEPVAWMIYTQDGQSVYVTDNPTNIQEGQKALPLYTTPPQRKPLTDMDIADIYKKWDATQGVSMADFARSIEAAHNIK